MTEEQAVDQNSEEVKPSLEEEYAYLIHQWEEKQAALNQGE